jgi:chaperonin GroEL
MRPTITLQGQKAKDVLKKGVNAIFNPVKATFGPEGYSALLYRTMNRGNRITDDGVTVSECQEPKDVHIRMVAATFREACKRTVEKVGDGTTCTAILGGKLFNEVSGKLEKNFSSIGVSNNKIGVKTLSKQILQSAEKVKEKILKSAKKIKTLADLEKVAIISVKDAELGKVIASMAWKVGLDGFIDVVEGYKGEIETEVIEGMRFPAKVAAKGFINNPSKFEMIARDCAVIITNYNLDNAVQLADILNPLLEKNPKIVILAPSFSNEVLSSLYKASWNTIVGKQGQIIKEKGAYDLFPVSCPSLREDQFDDLSIYFGARFIDKKKGDTLTSISQNDLGFVEKMVVKDTEAKEDAIATGGAGLQGHKEIKRGEVGFDGDEKKTKVAERIEVLKGQLAETKQEQFKKLLERRIASMTSAVGIIRVGDSTQASSLYRKLKVEDAVYACKSALKSGYVKGGGLCLKEIADKLPDTDIIKTTLLYPYELIQNSVEGGLKIEDDVLDPTDAIYYAVEHATQVVAKLITVDSITAEIEPPEPEEGSFEIAKWLREQVITEKIKEGQIKQGQEEEYRDSLGGMNNWEYTTVNQD